MATMEGETVKLTKLKGAKNWSIWKFQITVIMRAQGCFTVVTGEFTDPGPENQQQKNWTKMDVSA